MRWFLNIRTATKLALGFGTVLTLMVILSAISYNGLNKATKMSSDAFKGVSSMKSVETEMVRFRMRHYRVFLDTSKKDMKPVLNSIKEAKATVDQLLEDYKSGIREEQDKTNFGVLESAWSGYQEKDAKYLDLAERGKIAEAMIYIEGDLVPFAKEQLEPAIASVVKWNSDFANKMVNNATDDAHKAQRLLVIITSLSLVISTVFGTFLTKAITKPINALSDRMNSLNDNCLQQLSNGLAELKNGNLTLKLCAGTQPIDNTSHDELGKMCKVFNSMLGKVKYIVESYDATRMSLAEVIHTVQQNAQSVTTTSSLLASASADTGSATASIASTAQQVASANGEVARSSQQIAQGSEQLAGTATQAAAAMEKLDSAIASVKSESERQTLAVEEAAQNVEAGISAVERTAETMASIELQVLQSSNAVKDLGEKGQQIGEIVQTIEDIAQQTNLLALNAAIEAARAGEQGKGFAVVADEVRKLAERSALATQEIGMLIGSVRTGVEQAVKAMASSTAKVAEGASQSKETGSALQKIKATTESVSAAVHANQKAVAEMVKGAEKVTMSIATSASVSEENAASAEEMSATTEEVTASAQTVMASTEQASASVQQVSASAQQLNAMAEELNSVVQQFLVDERLDAANSTDHASARRAA